MKFTRCLFTLALLAASTLGHAKPIEGDSPADHLPPHIRQITTFGERPDWSFDGKKVLFLSKALGDAMEYDLQTGRIRNLTAGYPHYGYTRALYLINGDIFLVGPMVFDLQNAARAKWDTYMFILDRSGLKPPVPLGVRMNEGPAISRKRLHLAWAEWSDPAPGSGGNAGSKIYEGDIVYTNGVPGIENRKLLLDGAELGIPCTIEPQNYRPPAERELTFSIYSEAGRKSDVGGLDLVTHKVTNYTQSKDVYDEPEGIFPDGQATLVECDEQTRTGNIGIDIWKLSLDGTKTYRRLTYFTDYPHYKASNPVVSDDGKYFAFQMGKVGEGSNVGRGICIYDLTQAPDGK